MRYIIVIVLLAAVAYYVWNDEAQQPPVDARQVVAPDTEGGMIEEHLLAPLSKAKNFKDEKYVKALDEHRAEMDRAETDAEDQ